MRIAVILFALITSAAPAAVPGIARIGKIDPVALRACILKQAIDPAGYVTDRWELHAFDDADQGTTLCKVVLLTYDARGKRSLLVSAESATVVVDRDGVVTIRMKNADGKTADGLLFSAVTKHFDLARAKERVAK